MGGRRFVRFLIWRGATYVAKIPVGDDSARRLFFLPQSGSRIFLGFPAFLLLALARYLRIGGSIIIRYAIWRTSSSLAKIHAGRDIAKMPPYLPRLGCRCFFTA